MSGKELLTAQVIACTRLQSKRCGAPMVCWKGDLNKNSIPRMAGNSMSIPCLGFIYLAAICSLEPIV